MKNRSKAARRLVLLSVVVVGAYFVYSELSSPRSSLGLSLALSSGASQTELSPTGLDQRILDEFQGWGTSIPLIPDVFVEDTERSQVYRLLERSGYQQEFPHWSGLKPSFAAEEVFAREVNSAVCNIKRFVVLDFSNSGRLIHAEAFVHEFGCL